MIGFWGSEGKWEEAAYQFGCGFWCGSWKSVVAIHFRGTRPFLWWSAYYGSKASSLGLMWTCVFGALHSLQCESGAGAIGSIITLI